MRSSLLALATLVAFAAPAAAQDSRVYANINFGFQAQGQDFTQRADFPLYDETGNWEAAHSIDGGPFFDIGGGYRILRNVSVGLSFTARTGDSRDVTVNASVPSPIFTDTLRAASARVTGLEHTEQAFHIQALWHIPVTVEFDVALFAGPTIFRVKDELIGAVDFAEVGGDLSSVNIQNISTTEQKETTTGFHLGIDTRYMFMRDIGFIRNIGAGAMLRYSRGSVDLAAPAGSGGAPTSIDVGGLEIGVGLRFQF
jgi:opacity protein-like surface antigen